MPKKLKYISSFSFIWKRVGGGRVDCTLISSDLFDRIPFIYEIGHHMKIDFTYLTQVYLYIHAFMYREKKNIKKDKKKSQKNYRICPFIWRKL